MPSPERTSLDEIVATGAALLESGGLDRLTMQAVAEQVGVRAPSLYKRVRSRDHLIGLIAERTLDELTDRLDSARGGFDADPSDELRSLITAFRAFAHARPNAYRLVFAQPAAFPLVAEDALQRASRPVLEAAAALVGQDRALDAARTVTAWTTGFLFLELSGRFQLGGDVEQAFGYGIDLLAKGLTLEA
ncbi:MAG TPA: TetR-like C-terminal domain-containing protein [Leifsonia sp.]|jgi:AcrR family transcriptional regulator|nr:TetR-like C-terminal domain-containing protein [Leifsonia sp.]